MPRPLLGASIPGVDRAGTAVADFFEQLSRRGHEPVLEEVSGTIRFDLRDEHGTEHWYVAIEHGDVKVSREARPADCVMHTDRAVFERMATGQLHQLPAWLRHLFSLQGNPWLFRMFGPVFPSPAGAHDPRDLVSHPRRRQ